MEKISIDRFQIEKYLESRNIEYLTSGKNITPGWIGINCPWCDDPSNHLGINLDSRGISCWRCPTKGTIIKLIMKTEGISLEKAQNVIKQFSNRTIKIYQNGRKESDIRAQESNFYNLLQRKNQLDSLHRDYLASRNFDPDYIYDKYDLRCTGPFDNYSLRLIIPFYEQRRIVTFTTRDVTDLSPQPWEHCPKESSISHPKETLYNLDSIKDKTAIMVEGCSDVWNIGDGCISTSGTLYTHTQLKKLIGLEIVHVLYDHGATEFAEKLAYDINIFVPKVYLEILDKGDPAEMTKEEVREFRKRVFGKIY